MKFLEFWNREAHRFKGIVFDIDGTLVCGPRQLPGAAELLGSVRAAGIPLCFLTNDGDHTMEQKCSFLCRAGLPARPEEFISCLAALDTAAEENDWRGRTFFAIGSLGTIRCLQLERDPGCIDHCAGVIMGEGRYDWRGSWEAAVNFFRRHPERPFVVPNPDLCWPDPVSGGICIGAGGQARCIEHLLREFGIELRIFYLGKPYPAIYRHAFRELERRFGIHPEPSELLMLGDSLASDIRGANRSGMVSALVLTGITSQEQALAARGDFRPQYVFDSIN